MRIKTAGWVVATVVTIGCDRVTKHAATTMLAGQSDHSYLADTVRLGYVENTGGFLSLGASWPTALRTIFFTVATGVMLLTLTVVAFRRQRDRWSGLGFALFLAGGASNWVDRIARGSVVDFLNIGVGPVRTGVFNVADAAIMLGAAIFVLAELRSNRTMKFSSGTGDRPA
jgi:signal peptidase II